MFRYAQKSPQPGMYSTKNRRLQVLFAIVAFSHEARELPARLASYADAALYAIWNILWKQFCHKSNLSLMGKLDYATIHCYTVHECFPPMWHHSKFQWTQYVVRCSGKADACGFGHIPSLGFEAKKWQWYCDFSQTYIGIGLLVPKHITVSPLNQCKPIYTEP